MSIRPFSGKEEKKETKIDIGFDAFVGPTNEIEKKKNPARKWGLPLLKKNKLAPLPDVAPLPPLEVTQLDTSLDAAPLPDIISKSDADRAIVSAIILAMSVEARLPMVFYKKLLEKLDSKFMIRLPPRELSQIRYLLIEGDENEEGIRDEEMEELLEKWADRSKISLV